MSEASEALANRTMMEALYIVAVSRRLENPADAVIDPVRREDLLPRYGKEYLALMRERVAGAGAREYEDEDGGQAIDDFDPAETMIAANEEIADLLFYLVQTIQKVGGDDLVLRTALYEGVRHLVEAMIPLGIACDLLEVTIADGPPPVG